MAETADMTEAAGVMVEAAEMPAEATDMPAEIADDDQDAVLDMVALEMAAPDPADADEASDPGSDEIHVAAAAACRARNDRADAEPEPEPEQTASPAIAPAMQASIQTSVEASTQASNGSIRLLLARRSSRMESCEGPLHRPPTRWRRSGA